MELYNQYKKLIWIGVAAVVVLFLMFWLGGIYNYMVTLNQEVKVGWAEVENQLQRRYDLIPNLVETVKGYAKHEQTTFEDIAKARSAWANAQNMNQKVVAANGIESTIAKLFMVVENYPQLQASANFRMLQDELTGTENRVAVARGRYNNLVGEYNKYAGHLPQAPFVKLFGFDGEKILFKAAESAKEAPKVKF